MRIRWGGVNDAKKASVDALLSKSSRGLCAPHCLGKPCNTIDQSMSTRRSFDSLDRTKYIREVLMMSCRFLEPFIGAQLRGRRTQRNSEASIIILENVARTETRLRRKSYSRPSPAQRSMHDVIRVKGPCRGVLCIGFYIT